MGGGGWDDWKGPGGLLGLVIVCVLIKVAGDVGKFSL